MSAQKPAPGLASDAPKAHLLVAEDNPINQKVVGQQLQMLGYTSTIVDDGVAAIEALDGEACFDVLLTDCNMPRMDGYELARAVREREEYGGERLPIIALTANALVGELERCREAGMDDLVTKPTDLGRLGEALEAALSGNASADAAAGGGKKLLVDRAELRRRLGDEVTLLAGVLLQFRDYLRRVDVRLATHSGAEVAPLVEAVRRAAQATLAQPLARECDAYLEAVSRVPSGVTPARHAELRGMLRRTLRSIGLR